MHYFKSLTCLALICGTQASAATISAGVTRGLDQTVEIADTISESESLSLSNQFLSNDPSTPDTVFASADASINSVNGELRARVEKIEDINPFGDIVRAYVQLDESMTVTGNGTITFNLAYDGFWNTEQDTIFDARTFLRIFDGLFENETFSDGDVAGVGNTFSPIVGSTAGTLSVSAIIDGPKTLSLTAQLLTSNARGPGILDFSNTARLSFETTGDATVLFSDPDFLSGVSDDPDVSPVPLPAGFPLVLTGLGLLGALRLRRSNA